jgi:transcriptional activator of comK gene
MVENKNKNVSIEFVGNWDDEIKVVQLSNKWKSKKQANCQNEKLKEYI